MYAIRSYYGDRHVGRPILARLLDTGADHFDGFDNVGAGPLGDLQRNRTLAIDTGEALGVLEGWAQDADVARNNFV